MAASHNHTFTLTLLGLTIRPQKSCGRSIVNQNEISKKNLSQTKNLAKLAHMQIYKKKYIYIIVQACVLYNVGSISSVGDTNTRTYPRTIVAEPDVAGLFGLGRLKVRLGPTLVDENYRYNKSAAVQ